jgi:hypothetical protein
MLCLYVTMVWLPVGAELTAEQRAELRALMTSTEVSAAVGTRARIVLWHAEGRMNKDIAVLAGVSRPAVDLWLARYGVDGAAGLLARQPRHRGSSQALHPAEQQDS